MEMHESCDGRANSHDATYPKNKRFFVVGVQASTDDGWQNVWLQNSKLRRHRKTRIPMRLINDWPYGYCRLWLSMLFEPYATPTSQTKTRQFLGKENYVIDIAGVN